MVVEYRISIVFQICYQGVTRMSQTAMLLVEGVDGGLAGDGSDRSDALGGARPALCAYVPQVPALKFISWTVGTVCPIRL